MDRSLLQIGVYYGPKNSIFVKESIECLVNLTACAKVVVMLRNVLAWVRINVQNVRNLFAENILFKPRISARLVKPSLGLRISE